MAVATIWRRASRIPRWFLTAEPAVLVPLLLAVAGAWGFAELADIVMEKDGGAHAFDQAVLRALRSGEIDGDPVGPAWLGHWVRDITSLGGWSVLSLVTLACLGYLQLRGKTRLAAYFLVAVLGGFVLSFGLKSVFARPRPGLAMAASDAFYATASFPSGHAAMSAVVYLTAGALLAAVQPRRRLKAYIMALAVAVSVLIGLTRLYLGVHYATDVLAGWSIGTAWALVCWLLARILQRRGEIEQETGDPADPP